MAKTKHQSHQPSLYIVAAAAAVIILAVASFAHADEDRGNRGDRLDHVKSFLSFNLHDRRGDVQKEAKHASSTKSSHQTLAGSVSSVSVTGNTLILTGKFGTTTVSVSSDTKITGGATTLAGITAGDHVKARGTMSTSTNVFAAQKLTVNQNGLSQTHALEIIARLEAFIAKLKLHFGL